MLDFVKSDELDKINPSMETSLGSILNGDDNIQLDSPPGVYLTMPTSAITLEAVETMRTLLVPYEAHFVV